MDWLLPFRPIDNGPTMPPGLPRRLLKRLLRIGKISVGSRVLDAGCGFGELTRFLDDLSVDVSGIDESPACIAAAQRAARHLDYSCASAMSRLAYPAQQFDAVLARGLREYQGDLLGRDALRATAHLAATIRPQGRLIMIARVDSTWSNQPGGHLQTCFARHLDSFPGSCQVFYLVDSLLESTTWKWMLGRQPRAGFLVGVLAIPENGRSCDEWEQIAELAAQGRQEACCAWALKKSAETHRSRFAA